VGISRVTQRLETSQQELGSTDAVNTFMFEKYKLFSVRWRGILEEVLQATKSA
jgi:hypothetical protein